MTINELTELFGWMSAINVALLLLTTLSLMLTRDWLARLHARLFGVDEQALARLYVQYLSWYKLAVIVLNIVPYAALKLIS